MKNIIKYQQASDDGPLLIWITFSYVKEIIPMPLPYERVLTEFVQYAEVLDNIILKCYEVFIIRTVSHMKYGYDGHSIIWV